MLAVGKAIPRLGWLVPAAAKATRIRLKVPAGDAAALRLLVRPFAAPGKRAVRRPRAVAERLLSRWSLLRSPRLLEMLPVRELVLYVPEAFMLAALQLAAGGQAGGRLLVVSHHNAYQRDYVTLSDDGGASWRTVPQDFLKMDEALLQEILSDKLLHETIPKPEDVFEGRESNPPLEYYEKSAVSMGAQQD